MLPHMYFKAVRGRDISPISDSIDQDQTARSPKPGPELTTTRSRDRQAHPGGALTLVYEVK